MKKSKILIIILVLIIIIFISVLTLKILNTDKELPFAGVEWIRFDSDKQRLVFHENGHFGYSCSCGNPVDNADICENYKYDYKTQTITLDCGEDRTEKIEIISYEEDELTLKFEQKPYKRTFARKGSEKAKEMEEEEDW